MMRNKLYLNLLVFYILFSVPAIAQQTQLHYTIAPWFNNKKAAVSITLDDAILGQFTIAAPLLTRYNMQATFFITPRIMQQQKITWQMVKDAAAHGHEIANHTLTHPYLRRLQPDSIIYEVDACNKLIDENVTVQKCVTMAYPFGDGGYETDSEKVVLKTVIPYCIGSRGTRNNKLSYNAYDFATSNEAYYKVNSDMIADSATMAGLPEQLDATIAAGGWYVPTYHGIEDGWIITKKEIFETHLQAIRKRENDLWITTFANALKYHKERNSAALQITGEDKNTLTLSLTDTLSNSTLWNHPLTIILQRPGVNVKSIKQGSHSVSFTVSGDAITFNATPGDELITITKR